jgi:hypothetical protein
VHGRESGHLGGLLHFTLARNSISQHPVGNPHPAVETDPACAAETGRMKSPPAKPPCSRALEDELAALASQLGDEGQVVTASDPKLLNRQGEEDESDQHSPE